MKIKNLIYLLLFFAIPLIAQNEKLPFDPSVKTGVLKNGIKYYIQENKKPEKRCELRLIVNAGSVLETNDQKGLAHFVEHMAFNGTKNFKKNELINFLELSGVKFGPELNAYTSFDETVYMLQVPTDKPELVDKGFLVLSDWANGLAFDPAEIDKERGVITEEWRLGRGADMRMLDKQFPVLFYQSKYAERLPIGDINVIKNFKHSTLIDFYRTWYRPDLIAVAAVGDFSAEEIEKIITKYFSEIKAPEVIVNKEKQVIPSHDKTLFAIASDKEATYNVISIYYKNQPKKFETISDFKDAVIQTLFSGMLNSRLDELTRLSDPPFIYGGTQSGRVIREMEARILTAYVKDGGIDRGFESLLTEAERVKKFGFTESEFNRQKQIVIRGIEKRLAEKDKTESAQLIGDMIDNFLEDSPIMGIENVFKIYQKLLPEITLNEVNKLASELIKTENRVVMVSMPEKEGVALVKESELQTILDKVEKNEITAYIDKTNDKPLVETLPSQGKIVSVVKNDKLGLEDWKLSNGVRVVVKKTDFKNDEIVMNAFSMGGNSLVDEKDYIAAVTLMNLVGQSGVGGFNAVELKKQLAGKIVNVNPFVSTYTEGFNGSSSVKDIETLMQLIYLYFQPVRIDSSAFFNTKNGLTTYLQNAANMPEKVFSDSVGYLLSNYHYRSKPITLSDLELMNIEKSKSIYDDRFKDASDFTFVFVGSVEIEALKSLCEKYLAVLPVTGREDKWKDINLEYPKGDIERKVYKGIEPKSRVAVVFTGEFNWSREEEYLLESLIDALNIRLREVIREDKGGTYGVGVNQKINRIPKPVYSISVGWGCNPERVDELIKDMYSVIDSIKQFGVNEVLLDKVKETQRRTRESRLKQNGFWAGMLNNYLFYNENPEIILNYNEFVDKLTSEDIKRLANKYLNEKNYIKAVLYPGTQK